MLGGLVALGLSAKPEAIQGLHIVRIGIRKRAESFLCLCCDIRFEE